jgi:hypothetical protein
MVGDLPQQIDSDVNSAYRIIEMFQLDLIIKEQILYVIYWTVIRKKIVYLQFKNILSLKRT